MPMMPNWGWGGGFFWGPLLMVIFWIIILGGIVLLIYALVSPKNVSSSQGDSALEILKKRYARGEIDKKEFEERKKDLV